MNVIKNIFTQLEPSYLIKSYIISFVISYMCFFYVFADADLAMKVIVIINLILFPFSAIVYDSLIDLFFNGMVIILPIPIMVFYKLMKVVLLYSFAILIAPFGIIYLLIRPKIT